MEIIIRDNIQQYMKELKQWILESKYSSLEEMSAFFSERIDSYEEHMAEWKIAYQRFAKLLPIDCKTILDLGCGTGLELDEIFKLFPDVEVTGVDLCQTMLNKLLRKHRDKNLKVACKDYFEYDMSINHFDVILSFQSFHHYLPEKKQQLFQKIYNALQKNGVLIEGDYIACCEEEELLLQEVYLEKRKRFHIPEEQFVHLDIPLTLEHEILLLRNVGFKQISIIDSIQGATLILAKK